MQRTILSLILALALFAATRVSLAADLSAKEIYDRVSPSLVVVQYTLHRDDSSLQDLNTIGVVISEDGLVIVSSGITPSTLPDEQFQDFKIIIPGDEETKLDAVFQGRDDRTLLSYVKAKDPKSHAFKPLKIEDVPLEIGQPIVSVGLLPKDAGYKSYLMSDSVGAMLRGPVAQVLAGGNGLAAVGSPVLNMQGQVIGLVHDQNGTTPLLDLAGLGGGGARRGGRRGSAADEAFPSIVNPPKFFIPSREFLLSLSDPPTPESAVKIPQLGISGSGLKKAELDYYDLKGQIAVQINDVIPGFPADRGGLKQGDVIVQMNGQPLERGDDPDEAYYIMTRKVQQMKVGQNVKFTVVRKGQPNSEITIALQERPPQANKAKRYWADDLGFASREIVFDDTYARRIPADTKGVVVDLIKQQSAASKDLARNDLITRLNTVPVESIDQFKTVYEAFRKDHPREAVVMEVLRGPNTQIIRIEPPQ